MRIAAMLMIAALAMTGGVAEGQEPRLVYQSPSGIGFEVNADGLCAIRKGERTIARGQWRAWNAQQWFSAGSGVVKTPDEATKKTIEVLSPTHARVVQERGDIVCSFDYQFEQEDLTISSRIENLHPTETMGVTGFSGLRFDFDRPPEGLMSVQHITYFQKHGIKLCYPSSFCRIGGSYAADDSIGVGVSPWKLGMTRSLILWYYTDWRPEQREKNPSRDLMYFVQAPIPPRGMRTIDLHLRVSPDRDWKHLMEPYKQDLQATYGPVRYKADYRWIATDYLHSAPNEVNRSNPFGFRAGHRRIDTVGGADEFCRTHIPAIRDNGGQGIIVWGQGGYEPRGAMYRPDFDVMPPAVESLLPTITSHFRQAGLKFGIAARPGQLAIRKTWKQDEVVAMNPDDPAQLEALARRFETMRKLGCELFYLDSFGGSLEDVKTMRFLRERLGPDVLVFCEAQTDAIMPFGGGYTEITVRTPKDPPGGYFNLWTGDQNWEILQWLAPGCQLAARAKDMEHLDREAALKVDQYRYAHHITPLLPLPNPQEAQLLGELQRQAMESPVRETP